MVNCKLFSIISCIPNILNKLASPGPSYFLNMPKTLIVKELTITLIIRKATSLLL